MRIYSNNLLSLPYIIHILRGPSSNAIYWDNLYIFRIEPAERKPHPFISLLKENRKYYCYDNYYRNKYIEKFENVYKNGVYIPQFSMSDDTFVIKSNNPSILLSSSVLQASSINLPSWLKTYSPPLI